jgi:radical SAM superfamily enzyme YgiQ (UPF0313 family)
MHAHLISTYDLGRQPFGLASPVAWLRAAGFDVTCTDLAVERLDEASVASAGLIAIHLPMHAATRLATAIVPRLRAANPRAHLCFYGLYAPPNETLLRALGAGTILGGEFETGLVALAGRLRDEGIKGRGESTLSLARQRFLVPDRSDLAPLARYAHLHLADGRRRTVGYTESSRGCKHLCRHCPVVPVYNGTFRVVQREVVLEDVRQQVEQGAEHITFGDPDFFNGIGHAMAIAREIHAKHPGLTWDVTIKIEHLLRHRDRLQDLARLGCLFVTSAVESLDDRVLAMLDKGHTREDFTVAVRQCRDAGLVLNPTFVAFHPWITPHDYLELLSLIAELDLVDHVAPVQLALRLLIPRGSRLLDLPEMQKLVGPFDEEALVHPWIHSDSRVDELQQAVQALVERGAAAGRGRREIFADVRDLAARAVAPVDLPALDETWRRARVTVPYLTEPWYC